MKKNLFQSIFVGVIAGVVVFDAFFNALMLPDVWFSYSTGECVKVLNYADGDSYSCENMPSKFNHVWVK